MSDIVTIVMSVCAIAISCLSIGYTWGAHDERKASLYRLSDPVPEPHGCDCPWPNTNRCECSSSPSPEPDTHG